jgi:hypothetical protein
MTFSYLPIGIMSCPFANALGIPGQGFHAARIGEFALNDVLGTIGLAALTSSMANDSFSKHLLGWFVAAEVSHYYFGVDTAFLRLTGLSPRCDEVLEG